MARVALSNTGSDPYYRLLGNRPEILEAWARLDQAMLGPSGTLSVALKEEARRALAQDIGCAYCASVGGAPAASHEQPGVALAVALAAQIAADPAQIDDGTFSVLREEFTNEQIVELLAWLCFKYGSNLLGALVKLAPATEDDVATYASFLDAASVGAVE